MEFIIIAGERVQVPAEIVSEGRDAIEAWHQAQSGYIAPPPKELATALDDPAADQARLTKLDRWNADQLKAAKARVEKARAATATSAPASTASPVPQPAPQGGTE